MEEAQGCEVKRGGLRSGMEKKGAEEYGVPDAKGPSLLLFPNPSSEGGGGPESGEGGEEEGRAPQRIKDI